MHSKQILNYSALSENASCIAHIIAIYAIKRSRFFMSLATASFLSSISDFLLVRALLCFIHSSEALNFSLQLPANWKPTPHGTGRKLDVYKTFKIYPKRLLNVMCTFNLRSVTRGLFAALLQIIPTMRRIYSALTQRFHTYCKHVLLKRNVYDTTFTLSETKCLHIVENSSFELMLKHWRKGKMFIKNFSTTFTKNVLLYLMFYTSFDDCPNLVYVFNPKCVKWFWQVKAHEVTAFFTGEYVKVSPLLYITSYNITLVYG